MHFQIDKQKTDLFRNFVVLNTLIEFEEGL